MAQTFANGQLVETKAIKETPSPAYDFFSPKKSELKDPQSVFQTNHMIALIGGSADGFVERVHDEIYAHVGQLIDYRGKVVDLEKEDIEDCFGDDAGRYIRCRRVETKKKRKNRLPEKLVRREMFIHFAIEIIIRREFPQN